jgi:hypothetical protein
VLADAEKIGTIERQHRKLRAIEMEAYGLYAAVAMQQLQILGFLNRQLHQ